MGVSEAAGFATSRAQFDSSDEEVLQAYQQIRAERQRAEQQQQHMQQSSARGPQQQQVNGVAAGAAAGGVQQRDVTQLMADKMVAGWALLGDHCPM
jgi:hypothetical protein